MSGTDWLDVLRREFAAEDGSFLLTLRCDLRWDHGAFARLIAAMEDCCRALEKTSSVERWVANGFWYLSWFPESWISHEAWTHDKDRARITEGTQRLFELAAWFFSGESIVQATDVP
jgi:hypothetical protein